MDLVYKNICRKACEACEVKREIDSTLCLNFTYFSPILYLRYVGERRKAVATQKSIIYP